MEDATKTAEGNVPPPIQWKDVTEEFKQHLATLTEWDIRIRAGTSLKDLMSGPELNDPKTDLGHQWAENLPLSELVARGQIPKAGALSADDVRNTMDAILGLETALMGGEMMANTVMTCVYAHDPKLADGNASLKAFVQGTLKTVEIMMRTITMSDIVDVDEFPMATFLDEEKSLSEDISVDDVISNLSAAIDAEKDAAIKGRLTFRRDYLALVASLTIKADAATLSTSKTLANTAAASLEALSRAGDQVTHPQLFRKECATWLNIPVPVKSATPSPFAQVKSLFGQCIQNFGTIGEFAELKTLLAVTNALQGFALTLPLLFPRAALSNLISGSVNRPPIIPNIKLAGYPEGFSTLIGLVLRTFSDMYGAPIIEKVYNGDEETLMHMVDYWYSLQSTNISSSPEEKSARRKSISEQVQMWIVEGYCHSWMRFWTTLLRNKGRSHRGLANLLQDLAGLRRHAFEIDTTYFCSLSPMGKKDDEVAREWTSRSSIITAATVDLIMLIERAYLVATSTLELMTPAETLPFIWMTHSIAQVHAETLIPLVITQPGVIPPARSRRDGVPLIAPVVTTRTMSSIPPTVFAEFEIIKGCTSAVYSVACALDSLGLINLSNPKDSLTDVATIFNHRFQVVRFTHQTPPLVLEHRLCSQQYKTFADMGLKGAVEFGLKQLNASIENCKRLGLDGRYDGIANAPLRNVDRASKMNLIALKLLQSTFAKDTEEEGLKKLREKFTISLTFSEGYPKLSLKPQ